MRCAEPRSTSARKIHGARSGTRLLPDTQPRLKMPRSLNSLIAAEQRDLRQFSRGAEEEDSVARTIIHRICVKSRQTRRRRHRRTISDIFSSSSRATISWVLLLPCICTYYLANQMLESELQLAKNQSQIKTTSASSCQLAGPTGGA